MNGATEHLLHVVMNGRVIGDVQRSGKRRMRLRYENASGNDLSMAVNGRFRAAAVSVNDWARFATTLHVNSDWLRDEITRQSDGLLDAMVSATKSDDIARYDSPAVARLLANTEAWLKRVGRS